MSSSSCGVLPLTPIAPMTRPRWMMGSPPWSGAAPGRPSAATRPFPHLLLENPARPAEDGCRPGLGNPDLDAGDLRVVETVEDQEVATVVHDRNDDRRASTFGLCLGSFGNGFGSAEREDLLSWERIESGGRRGEYENQGEQREGHALPWVGVASALLCAPSCPCGHSARSAGGNSVAGGELNARRGASLPARSARRRREESLGCGGTMGPPAGAADGGIRLRGSRTGEARPGTGEVRGHSPGALCLRHTWRRGRRRFSSSQAASA